MRMHTATRSPSDKPRQRRKQPASMWRGWWLVFPAGAMLLLTLLLSSLLALHVAYSQRVLPRVYAGDISLSGLSQQAAAETLRNEWQMLTLRDADRTWPIAPAQFGLILDADRTAREALNAGRPLRGWFQRVNVAPVVGVDVAAMRDELARIAPLIEMTPVNAGIGLQNGEVVATPARPGRALNMEATIGQLQAAPETALKNGELRLSMQDITPDVTDAAPLVAQARELLNNPLTLRLYDPVTGDTATWSAAPSEWAHWLTAATDTGSLSLRADSSQIRDFLAAEANTRLDNSRTLDLDTAVQRVQEAISAGRNTIALTIQHQPRTHTVQAGDSLTAIAWRYGMPYPYIQQANGGLEGVRIGQQITIPAADSFLLYDPVPNKRIIVDMSEQVTRVYENGALKWEWLSSTGIDDSPTWPGVYQVISHEPNAYAGNWNLWMPNFIGVYRPVPGADFTNGFHGFPTRGGGRLLWQNDLGRRVTYGCILLSDANVQLLYNWAETGVVVEIRP